MAFAAPFDITSEIPPKFEESFDFGISWPPISTWPDTSTLPWLLIKTYAEKYQQRWTECVTAGWRSSLTKKEIRAGILTERLPYVVGVSDIFEVDFQLTVLPPSPPNPAETILPYLVMSPPISAHVRSTTMPLYDPGCGDGSLWCAATGCRLPANQVTCAHLVPKKWHSIAPRIGIKDIHDASNVLPLHSAIEAVFDSGEIMITYEKAKAEHVMYLLNRKLGQLQIDPKDKCNGNLKGVTYADLHGKALRFLTTCRPSKRSVQFVAHIARFNAIDKGWITANDYTMVTAPENNSPDVLENTEFKKVMEWLEKTPVSFQ